jgi:hypothetical protein
MYSHQKDRSKRNCDPTKKANQGYKASDNEKWRSNVFRKESRQPRAES